MVKRYSKKLKKFTSKQFSNVKKELVRRKDERRIVRKAQRQSLFEARKKEAVTFGKQKALHERKVKLKRLQEGGVVKGFGSVAKELAHGYSLGKAPRHSTVKRKRKTKRKTTKKRKKK